MRSDGDRRTHRHTNGRVKTAALGIYKLSVAKRNTCSFLNFCIVFPTGTARLKVHKANKRRRQKQN